MRDKHPLLECASIEWPWFPAGFAFNQRSSDGLNLGATFLLPPNEVADVFAVVGVVPCAESQPNEIGNFQELRTETTRPPSLEALFLLVGCAGIEPATNGLRVVKSSPFRFF